MEPPSHICVGDSLPPLPGHLCTLHNARVSPNKESVFFFIPRMPISSKALVSSRRCFRRGGMPVAHFPQLRQSSTGNLDVGEVPSGKGP